MMYALEPRVYNPVWAFVQHLLPPRPTTPGRGRPRCPDDIVFRALLIRLVTGNSWQTIEFTLDNIVSDTTLRTRRDEWLQTGVFHQLLAHAIHAYRHLIGFDLNRILIDGTNHRTLNGGPGTGFDPKNKGKRGFKTVLATDANGIPISFTLAPANANDYPLMFDVLDELEQRDQLRLIGELHADRGFNYASTPQRLADTYNITNFIAPTRNDPHQGRVKRSHLGARWPIERTNAWLHSYGQLQHNRDRNPDHRHAAISLAIALFLIHRITHPKHSPWRPTQPIFR